MGKNQIKDNQDLKELVKQRYSELALNTEELKGCCYSRDLLVVSKKVFTIASKDYTNLKGYEPDTDLEVGCGLPTQYANISEGDTVVDLGSGAGNDCFVTRAGVGESGKTAGTDSSPQMITEARNNALKRGYVSVEFLEGGIENMFLPDNMADVIVGNCVLNLLPEKNIIFKEIYHMLKPGGHFCISDVVLNGISPKKFIDNVTIYAGCIVSAIQKEDYLQEIEKTDSVDIRIARTKTALVPDEVLYEHLDEDAIRKYKPGSVGIYSVTIAGGKRPV